MNKNGKNKFNTMLSMDDEDRDMLKETRDNKFLFETKKYNEMKKLEEKRIMLEEKRLGMEEHSIHLKNESLVINNNLERSKLVLLKLDIFSKREVLKQNNSNITDEYLNIHFPYPE